MGNFSRNTFDKLKHYVGVRLQQGVPIVDADWNEQEDIRKYELQTFLKWFVGDGVPKGNDGFRIEAIVPVTENSNNDFTIKGGDGTPEGAGRCLVEGWDAVIEQDLKYTEQPLYNNANLAEKWQVLRLPALTKPREEVRTDTVYLDLWEREVDGQEDGNLVNEKIGVETCVRVKLEWVVRVAEGTTALPRPPSNHVFYRLATFTRSGATAAILSDHITDLRRTGLAILPKGITIKDGNVGIGTPNPQRKLHVLGDRILLENAGKRLEMRTDGNAVDLQSVNHDLYIRSTDSSGKNNVIINPFARDGFVGIGTQNPTSKFHLKGSKATDAIVFIQPGEWKTGDYGEIRFGDQYHYIRGEHTTGMTLYDCDKFQFLGGNVGIGTTNPGAPIEVQKTGESGKVVDLLILDSNNAGLNGGGALVFKGSGSVPNVRAKIVATYQGSINGDLRFYTTTSHTVGTTEKMRITPDGNVGIGTTDPGMDKLDVRGRCYSSGGWSITNADYAEYFESDNGSVIPVATSVSITEDGKIRPAKEGETPIGIVSTNSAFVGNSYREWPKKYLRDEFNNLILEKYEEEVMIPKKEKKSRERQKVEKKTITEEVNRTEVVFIDGKYIQKEQSETITREVDEPLFEEVDLYDATGENVIGKHQVPVIETYEEEIEVLDADGQPVLVGSGEFVTRERPTLNPEYDTSKQYVLREDRPEWNCVGLLGQLPMRKGQPVADNWIKIKDISDDVELWLVK